VRNLAQIVPVTVSQNEQGAYQLYIQSGMPLVVGTDCYQLKASPNPANDNQRDILWVNQQGTQMDISKQLQTGTLGATLQLRDQTIPEQLAKLDRVAAEFVMAFNAQHRAGTGLDGVSGRDFFGQLPVYTHAGTNNQGGATVTASSIVTPAATTFDNYQIQFTAPGAYNVVNTTTGATVVAGGAYTSGTPIAFDGLSVTIGDTASAPQTGDTFAVSIVTGAAANVGISAALAASTDVIAAGQSASSGDNRNALALAGLESQNVAIGGTVSLRQLYQNMLVELGVETDAANQQDKSQGNVLTQTTNLVESVSGVNTDEEATNLIAFQRAFQASSKVISVTDTMMQTLIDMVR
jgi:flagellar hook-associated protein 1 FlgK